MSWNAVTHASQCALSDESTQIIYFSPDIGRVMHDRCSISIVHPLEDEENLPLSEGLRVKKRYLPTGTLQVFGLHLRMKIHERAAHEQATCDAAHTEHPEQDLKCDVSWYPRPCPNSA